MRFIFEGKSYYTDGIFKNEKKIACVIPDMADIPVGDQKVFVDVSFNGQQFTSSAKVLLYQCIFISFPTEIIAHDRSLSPEDLKKLDEQSSKDKKKAPAGKPGVPAAQKKKK